MCFILFIWKEDGDICLEYVVVENDRIFQFISNKVSGFFNVMYFNFS